MSALLIGAAVTVLAAFGAAWYGARLQRKWTPNPIPAIDGLGGRIAELRERIEAVEQERVESERFTLAIRLSQGVSGNYILDVRNDTDKDVLVGTVQIFRDDTPLSEAGKPRPSDDWSILAHKGKQLWWSPQPDPVNTLIFSEPNLSPFVGIRCRIILECRSDGKQRTAQRSLVVAVDSVNRTLTQRGP